MNNNTKKRLCTVEDCDNEQHSKGYCRRHYRLANISFCEVDGCTNVNYARGYCSKHYKKLYRNEVCKYKGCDRLVDSKGYCTKHYRRFLVHGDPSIVKSKKVDGTCKVDGCDSEIHAIGYCTRHYQRFRKHGTTSKDVLTMNIYHDGICSINGCGGKYHAKNLCEKHYKRKYKRIYSETKTGRENIRNYVIRRRARKRNSPINDYSVGDWNDSLKYFNNKCAYCGKKNCTLEREHVIPVSRGGSNTKTNIVPSCGHCNQTKGTKTLLEWYKTSEQYCAIREKRILDYLGYKVTDNKIQLQFF